MPSYGLTDQTNSLCSRPTPPLLLGINKAESEVNNLGTYISMSRLLYNHFQRYLGKITGTPK